MGVIGHARLPHVTPQTLGPLHSHLLTAHSATRTSSWSVTIRTLRSVPSPSLTSTADESGPSSSTAQEQQRALKRLRLAQAKVMHFITFRDSPEKVIVVVDDAARESKVERRNRDARDIAKRLLGLGEDVELGMGAGEAKSVAEAVVGGTEDASPSLDAPKDDATPTDVPSRYTLFIASASLYSQLAASSRKDVGFGVWAARGGVITIEGSEWQLRRSTMLGGVTQGVDEDEQGTRNDEEPSYSGHGGGNAQQTHDWTVRIGCIQAGGAPRGGVIEAEFHPLHTLPATSPLVSTFLSTLLPPYLLIPPNTPPSNIPPLILQPPATSLWDEVGIADTDGDGGKGVGQAIGWMGLTRRKRLACDWVALCKDAGVL